ncbi:MAG: hypothetical protein AB7P52_05135 [Alphaproteobacteria bacterium]
MDERERHEVLREWARKMYLREHMRTDALSTHELKALDERLARWTADRQHEGTLPPEWELNARRADLTRSFRHGRDEARPLFTPEELRDVDASRAAAALRDQIERKTDYAGALSRLATQYAVANGLNELDARKNITDRFGSLFGRSVLDYAREQHRRQSQQQQHGEDRLFPAEWGWDRYEPAYRRLLAYDAVTHIGREDGTLSAQEISERGKRRARWVAEQQRHDRLPRQGVANLRTPSPNEILLPRQKAFAREERRRSQGADGAYWRAVDGYAGFVKQEIREARRYTRIMDDCAIEGAESHGRPVAQVKRDIESRFTLHNLDTPAEYLEGRLERDRRQADERSRDDGQTRSESKNRKNRDKERDGGREM